MILILFYLLFFIYPSTILSLYLSKLNQDLLFHIIRNPKTSFQQRAKINIILFHCYKKWAIKQAFAFKMKHKYKCKQIHISELISYSTFGLYKSILKYNGKHSFVRFSTFYVNGELYKGLTNAYSMSSISKYERMKSKLQQNINKTVDKTYKNDNNLYNNLHNKKLYSFILASFDEEWKFNQRKSNPYADNKIESLEKMTYNEKMREIWEIIKNHDAFTYRILDLKYDYEFNVIRTNKNISSLMSCSEEYVRKKIAFCKTNIYNLFINKSYKMNL